MPKTDPTESPAQHAGEIPAVRWLAGQAMQGLVNRHGVPDSETAREEFALWAYRMAQSMLKVESQLHAVGGEPPRAGKP